MSFSGATSNFFICLKLSVGRLTTRSCQRRSENPDCINQADSDQDVEEFLKPHPGDELLQNEDNQTDRQRNVFQVK